MFWSNGGLKVSGCWLRNWPLKRRFGERGLYQCHWEEFAQRGKEPETGKKTISPRLQKRSTGWGLASVQGIWPQESHLCPPGEQLQGMGGKGGEGAWARICKMCIWWREGEGAVSTMSGGRRDFIFLKKEKKFCTLLFKNPPEALLPSSQPPSRSLIQLTRFFFFQIPGNFLFLPLTLIFYH